jgi:arsenate reductase
MSVTIWHNPRCSTSRKTLELLRSKGIQPEIREYLKEPPDAAEIGRVLGLLGMEPRELMRRKEPAYADGRLDRPELSRDALIRAMAEQPILIERPVVLAGGKAALGRPPESVLGLLGRA